MRQAQFWKRTSGISCCTCMLLLLMLAERRGAEPKPAAGKAKADRLVMGLILPYRDSHGVRGSLGLLTT